MSEMTSNRRSLVILFGIGFVPLIIAWVVFFYFPELMPTSTTNEGDLITPTVQASELGLPTDTGKWSLVVPVSMVCAETCEERLFLARQVNVALGKEAPRVQRILLAADVTDTEISRVTGLYPDMLVVRSNNTQLKAQLLNKTPDVPNGVYLMDPIGNIFMVYSIEKAGKPMLKDIKHLLKISNIG